MRRSLPQTSSTTRIVAIGQLACVGVGMAIVFRVWRHSHDSALLLLMVIGAVAAVLTLYGMRVLVQDREASANLAQTMVEERRLTASLEEAVERRTSELEDAQRVLQRMWWLGQQITMELNPQRVLDRFLEAVADVAHADGSVVGLTGVDGMIRVVIGTGIGHQLTGASVPIVGSAMGHVIRSGDPWTVANIDDHVGEIDPALYQMLKGKIHGVAIVPISRRGERIGGVTLLSKEEREFTPADLARVASMGDLLSVSLENAELVETLRQTEWRFRTLFRAAPDAVFTVLQSGQIREANDAVRDLTGADPLLAVGREVVELVVDADRDKLRAALEATFNGAPSRVEVAFQHEARGKTVRRVVALAMSRLPEADPPTVLLLGRDMTSEREMRVRLMESDRLAAVGELVAGVAHEVNNPLSSISAFAQLLLRDGGLTPAQRDSIEVIRSETTRASQVVKDLLAFARRSDAQREPLDLNALLARTLRLRTYQLTSNRVHLETDYGPELPPVVGDGRQLQQVCLNLITNAIQAMHDQGGGTLFVATRRDGNNVVLDMRDTGSGIPDGAKVHVFEPFFTTKAEGEGTGLGLSVSYGIVTAHRGTIEVAETSSAGTTFRVTLPGAADEEIGDEPKRTSGGYTLRSPLAGIRLLFIDDEPSLRHGMEAFGRLRGFTVVTAANGIEALDILRAGAVDAIVCDLRMPGMDGPAFHERLRRDRPGLVARTVFITGDVVSSSGRLAAIKQPILPKPFTFEKLEEVLVALMRGTPVATSVGWP